MAAGNGGKVQVHVGPLSAAEGVFPVAQLQPGPVGQGQPAPDLLAGLLPEDGATAADDDQNGHEHGQNTQYAAGHGQDHVQGGKNGLARRSVFHGGADLVAQLGEDRLHAGNDLRNDLLHRSSFLRRNRPAGQLSDRDTIIPQTDEKTSQWGRSSCISVSEMPLQPACGFLRIFLVFEWVSWYTFKKKEGVFCCWNCMFLTLPARKNFPWKFVLPASMISQRPVLGRQTGPLRMQNSSPIKLHFAGKTKGNFWD